MRDAARIVAPSRSAKAAAAAAARAGSAASIAATGCGSTQRVPCLGGPRAAPSTPRSGSVRARIAAVAAAHRVSRGLPLRSARSPSARSNGVSVLHVAPETACRGTMCRSPWRRNMRLVARSGVSQRGIAYADSMSRSSPSSSATVTLASRCSALSCMSSATTNHSSSRLSPTSMHPQTCASAARRCAAGQREPRRLVPSKGPTARR